MSTLTVSNGDRDGGTFTVARLTNPFFVEQGGSVAHLIKRETPGEEVLSSKPAVAARSLLAGSMSV